MMFVKALALIPGPEAWKSLFMYFSDKDSQHVDDYIADLIISSASQSFLDEDVVMECLYEILFCMSEAVSALPHPFQNVQAHNAIDHLYIFLDTQTSNRVLYHLSYILSELATDVRNFPYKEEEKLQILNFFPKVADFFNSYKQINESLLSSMITLLYKLYLIDPSEEYSHILLLVINQMIDFSGSILDNAIEILHDVLKNNSLLYEVILNEEFISKLVSFLNSESIFVIKFSAMILEPMCMLPSVIQFIVHNNLARRFADSIRTGTAVTIPPVLNCLVCICGASKELCIEFVNLGLFQVPYLKNLNFKSNIAMLKLTLIALNHKALDMDEYSLLQLSTNLINVLNSEDNVAIVIALDIIEILKTMGTNISIDNEILDELCYSNDEIISLKAKSIFSSFSLQNR